jgi:hypothetical protein
MADRRIESERDEARSLLKTVAIGMAEREAFEFTGPEVALLRVMVEEWIDEGFTTPPYTSEHYAIFEKLGITNETRTNLAIYDVDRPGKAANG